jgi:hypothetical protein
MQILSAIHTRALIFFAFVFGALVAYYLPFLNGSRSFYISDFTYYFEPCARFFAESLKQKHFPLWNPYVYCGMAQIAVPSPSVFYPFTWLHAVFPFSETIGLTLVFHQFICALGGFLLISSLGWGFFAAVCTAIILAFNHYLFSLQSNYTLVCTASWMPLLLWTIYEVANPAVDRVSRFLNGRNWCVYLSAVLSAALFMMAGRPEIFLPGGFFIGLFAVYVTQNQFSGKSIAFRFWRLFLKLSPFVFGLLVALPTLLPALEWMRLSPRATGLKAEEVLSWSTNWYDLLSLYMEYALGDLSLGVSKYLAFAGSRSDFIPYISSSFIGPVALTLAFWGFLDKNWRGRIPLLWILGAVLILTLGNNTPIAPFLVNTVPAFGIFRYPVKLLFFVVLIVSIAAGRGASLAFHSRASFRSEIIVIIFWLTNFFVSSLFMVPGLKDWISASSYLLFRGSAITDMQIWQDALTALSFAMLKASLIGFSICAIAYLSWRDKFKRVGFAAVIVLELFVTLFFSASAYASHGTDPEFFDYPIAVADNIRTLDSAELRSLGAQRERMGAKLEPRFLSLIIEGPTAPPGLSEGKKGDAFTAAHHQYHRQLLLHGTNMDAHLPSSFGYTMAEVAGYRNWFFDSYFSSSQSYRNPLVPSSAGDMLGKPPAAKQVTVNPTLDVCLSRFCRLTATKYVLTQSYKVGQGAPKPVDLPFLNPLYFKFIQDNKQLNYRIYSVVSPYPRAYLTSKYHIQESHQKSEQTLSSNTLTVFDVSALPRQLLQGTPLAGYASGDLLTVVEPSEGLSKNESTGVESTVDAKKEANRESGSVIFEQDDPEYIRLKAVTKSDSLLVLCDQYYPGWRAIVDGVNAKLLEANGFMRAVHLKPGTHAVEFIYEPDSLKFSIWACLLTLAALAGTSVIVLIRYVRKQEPKLDQVKD